MKIYNSADSCPIGVFWKVQETNDLSWLIIQPKENYLSGELVKITPEDIKILIQKYNDIENSFPVSAFDEKDVDNRCDYQEHLFYSLTATTDIERAQALNYLNIIEDDVFKKGGEEDKMLIVTQIESELNRTLDIYDSSCSITKFYNNISILNKKAKQANSNNKKNGERRAHR